MSRFIAEAAFDVISVRMPPVLIHPIAADDVASELANIEVGLPVAAQEPNVVSLMSKDLTPIQKRKSQ